MKRTNELQISSHRKKLKRDNDESVAEVIHDVPSIATPVDDDEEDIFSTTVKMEDVQKSDKDILEKINQTCTQSSKALDVELEETKLKYYCSYFKKAIQHLPPDVLSVDAVDIENNHEGFLKAYSIIKTWVNCEIQMKSYLAFNAIFNVANNIVAKLIHNNFIMPYLSNMVDEKVLCAAFSHYQTCVENDKPSELQCVAYLVQTEIQKKQPLQIPNPMYHSFTNHMQAVSKYITHLLKAIAQHHLQETASP